MHSLLFMKTTNVTILYHTELTAVHSRYIKEKYKANFFTSPQIFVIFCSSKDSIIKNIDKNLLQRNRAFEELKITQKRSSRQVLVAFGFMPYSVMDFLNFQVLEPC